MLPARDTESICLARIMETGRLSDAAVPIGLSPVWKDLRGAEKLINLSFKKKNLQKLGRIMLLCLQSILLQFNLIQTLFPLAYICDPTVDSPNTIWK